MKKAKAFNFKLLMVLFSFNLISEIFSQTPVWTERYNGAGNVSDGVNSMILDNGSGVIVTGGASSSQDIVTVKYALSGGILWTASYNGTASGSDIGFDLTNDNNNNIYVCGWTSGSVGGLNGVILKYDLLGIQKWAALYNGTFGGTDLFSSIACDRSTGDVYAAGQVQTTSSSSDMLIIKYNSVGVQQWAVTYSGPGTFYDNAVDIELDAASNVYVTGTMGISSAYNRWLTLKYNSAGVFQWAATYIGPSISDSPTDIQLDAAANVYVTGRSSGGISSQEDYFTVKYNTAGVELWTARYNGLGNYIDQALSVAVDLGGNVYVTGFTTGASGQDDITTVKYNSAGTQQWVVNYNSGGTNYDVGNVVRIDNTPDQNVYVTGQLDGLGNADYCTIKYNSSGIQQWLVTYDGTAGSVDSPTSMLVDNSLNVYVSGQSQGIGSSYDYLTLKYSQVIGISIISVEVPGTYNLYQNYPNPFNPSTKIRFDVPLQNKYVLEIYDILGRKIAELLNQVIAPGKYETEWDAYGFSSGIYYYKLTSPGYSETKKMLLLK